MYFTIRHIKSKFWTLSFLISTLFISCLNTKNEASIVNRENLRTKLEEAFENIMKSDDENMANIVLELIENENIVLEEPEQKGLYRYLVGHRYFLVNQYNKAETNFTQAIAIFESLGDSVKLAACYNEIAIIYSQREQNERALEYYLISIDKIKVEDFPEIAIDINYNIMCQYQDMARSDDAKTHALKGVEMMKKYNVRMLNLKFAYDALAEYEQEHGNYEEAKKYLEMALEAPCKIECFIARKIIYERYAAIYVAQGDYRKANEYYEQAIENYQKFVSQKRDIYIDQVSREIKLKDELDLKSEEVRREQNTILYGTLFFLGLTLLYAIYVLRQRRRVNKALDEINSLNIKLQNTLISKDIVNLDLENKKNEVQSLLQLNERALFSKELKLSTIKENIAKIAEELSKLAESDAAIRPNLLLGYEKKLLSVVTDEGIWEDFKIQFEQIRPDFFKKLKNAYPNLSVNDLKHCSYIISNLKTKDVANLINVSARSVETARYRIKKKMELDKDQDLFSHLQKI